MTPGWTLRDHVAHLADWMDEGARAIDAVPRHGCVAVGPRGGRRCVERAARRRAPPRVSDRNPRALRRRACPAADRGRIHERRGAPLARWMELGVRLPPRSRAQAPRDGRPLVRRDRLADGLMADESSPGAGDGRSGSDDRGDRRRRLAARVPHPSTRPRRRVYRRGSWELGSSSRCRCAGPGRPRPDHGLRQAGRRPPVVARRSTARVRQRGRDLDRRSRWLALDEGRREAGRWSRPALVTRRSASRVHLATPRMDVRSGSIDAPVPRRGRPQREPRAADRHAH